MQKNVLVSSNIILRPFIVYSSYSATADWPLRSQIYELTPPPSPLLLPQTSSSTQPSITTIGFLFKSLRTPCPVTLLMLLLTTPLNTFLPTSIFVPFSILETLYSLLNRAHVFSSLFTPGNISIRTGHQIMKSNLSVTSRLKYFPSILLTSQTYTDVVTLHRRLFLSQITSISDKSHYFSPLQYPSTIPHFITQTSSFLPPTSSSHWYLEFDIHTKHFVLCIQFLRHQRLCSLNFIC